MSREGAKRYSRKFRLGLIRRLSAAVEARCLRRALSTARAGGIVLDLPCGAGRFAGIVSRAADYYAGMDLSIEMIRIARTAAAQRYRMGFGVGDAVRIPLKSSSVEGTVAARLLYHLPGREARKRAIGEFARVSSRFFVVSFLDATCLRQKARVRRRAASGRPVHREAVDPSELGEDAAGCGFELAAVFHVSRIFSGQAFALFTRSARQPVDELARIGWGASTG